MGGDYEADDVARDMQGRPGFAAVDAVFDHVRRNPGNGFECHVHPTDAYAWVKENRQALLDDLRRQMFIEGEADYVGPGKPHWDEDPS